MTSPADVARVIKPQPKCKKYGYASERFANMAMYDHVAENQCSEIGVYRCECGFLHIGHTSKVHGDACKERRLHTLD